MIESAIKFAKRIFAHDCSGHDYHHTMRGLMGKSIVYIDRILQRADKIYHTDFRNP